MVENSELHVFTGSFLLIRLPQAAILVLMAELQETQETLCGSFDMEVFH